MPEVDLLHLSIFPFWFVKQCSACIIVFLFSYSKKNLKYESSIISRLLSSTFFFAPQSKQAIKVLRGGGAC